EMTVDMFDNVQRLFFYDISTRFNTDLNLGGAFQSFHQRLSRIAIHPHIWKLPHPPQQALRRSLTEQHPSALHNYRRSMDVGWNGFLRLQEWTQALRPTFASFAQTCQRAK